MAAAMGACLNHVSRESTDIKRLAQFYIEVFGFEQVECPRFEFDVIWLKLGSSFYLHLIERDPNTKLPEGPWSATSALAEPKNLPRVQAVPIPGEKLETPATLPSVDILQLNPLLLLQYHPSNMQEKGIEVYERVQPDGKTKQAFFFDPDRNGLEVSSQGPVQ